MPVVEQAANPAPERRRVRIDLNLVVMFVVFAALILSPLFGPAAALVFLMFGALFVVLNAGRSVQAVVELRYLFVLPLFCLASVFWSQFPAVSLRYATQLAITFVIAVSIGWRMSPTLALRSLFGVYGIGFLGSLLFGHVRADIGAWVGIFGSKNAFAAVVGGFALTSIAVVADRNAPIWMRLFGLVGILAAGPALLKAQSAGAIVILLPAVAVCVAILMSKYLSILQKVFVGFIVLIFMAGAIVIALSYRDVLLAELLNYTGKDATLTGRTDLWDYALQIIPEHPLLGLGYQAFWVHGYGPAELLWSIFGIESRVGFHFHNMYISNAVEIGVVGVAIEVLILYGALAKTLIWAIRRPSPENAFLAAFLTMIVCSSFTEVPVFFQFNITTCIVLCAFAFATLANRRLKSERADPRPLSVESMSAAGQET